MIEKLESGLARLGLDVPPPAAENLLAYMELLREWSRTYNLIAPRDREFLLERHILDSLSITNWLQPGSLLDVGTGAGLPGLPVAIVNPDRKVTMIDSTGKKIRFIRHVERMLKLPNIQPLQQRVEDLVTGQAFPNITARAFTSLRGFVEAARPQADEKTHLLAMKGMYPEWELEELPDWVEVVSVEKLTVPGLDAERHLVIMSLSTPGA